MFTKHLIAQPSALICYFFDRSRVVSVVFSRLQAQVVPDDLYARLKELESQIEFIDIQEEYVKTELKNLKRELIRSKQEIQVCSSRELLKNDSNFPPLFFITFVP